MLTYSEYFKMVKEGLVLYQAQVNEAQLFTEQQYQKALQDEKAAQQPEVKSEQKAEEKATKKVTK